MKKSIPILIFLSLVIIACGSTQNLQANTANPAKPPFVPLSPKTGGEPATSVPPANTPISPTPTKITQKFSLLLSNYTLTDAGDGWNEGIV